MTYVCSELINNSCSAWVINNSIFDISIEDGLQIGSYMFLICITAWGLRETARFILNRK